jgi:hypothetical protein
LEKSGFTGSPRVFGTCGQTEILSYIDGRAGRIPPPEWALTDDALVTVAALLRNYHQHAVAFEAGNDGWQRAVPPQWRGSLITHNDTNPANIIFRNGAAVALIDFDLAAPGSIAWELAVAGCFWAPLLDPRDVADSRHGHGIRRFRFCWTATEPRPKSGGTPPRPAPRQTTGSPKSSRTAVSRVIPGLPRRGHVPRPCTDGRTAGSRHTSTSWPGTRSRMPSDLPTPHALSELEAA